MTFSRSGSPFSIALEKASACWGVMQWGQRWDVRVGYRLDDDGPVGAQGGVPGGANLIRPIHSDPLQADEVGVAGVRKIGQLLRIDESRKPGKEPAAPT